MTGPKCRPSFEITFQFTDFSGGLLNYQTFADSLFQMVAESKIRLRADDIDGNKIEEVDEDILNDGWSIDGCEVVGMSATQSTIADRTDPRQFDVVGFDTNVPAI